MSSGDPKFSGDITERSLPRLRKVVITMNPDQALDSDAVARSEMARQ